MYSKIIYFDFPLSALISIRLQTFQYLQQIQNRLISPWTTFHAPYQAIWSIFAYV